MAEQSTLRSLAKAYANGQIKKDKYRKDRTAYLEAVLAGDVSLPDMEAGTSSPNLSSTYNKTIKKEAFQRTVPTTQQETAKSQNFLAANKGLMIGAAALGIIIIIALVLFTDGDELTTPQQVQQTTSPATQTAPSAAQNLVTRFVDENNWSQANLDQFLMSWRGVSETERTAAMTSTEFSRFINAIYKKLLEERALSRIGNPQTSYEKQRLLVEFASTIGINDQRISLPDEPAVNGQ